MRIQYACVCHPGLRRKSNQDNLVWEEQCLPRINGGLSAPVIAERSFSEPMLFGVFDGMGGEPRGDAAAWLAAETAALSGGVRSGENLESLCRIMNGKICDYARANKLSACGTTAALLLVENGRITGCNLGDSRIYQYRHCMLSQASEDHVLPFCASGKPPLLQYLGIPEEEMRIEPFLFQEKLQPNDLYLLCSDGLTDMLDEDRILHILLESGSVEERAEALLSGALAAGGKDNISFILVRNMDNK